MAVQVSRRSIVLRAAAGVILGSAAPAVMLMPERPPCLVVQTDPYTCLDDRLTERADAQVIQIVESTPDG